MARRPPPELTDGSPNGAFTLDEELGTGATSEVWRARPVGDDAPVVLKIGREPAHARALATEALVTSLALSPRLPELVALGTLHIDGTTAERASAGRPFIALRDHGAGTSLAQTARDDARLALSIARDVGEALADLHAVGIAHGDVKPQNVILCEGRAQLIDLGLAVPSHRPDVSGATVRYLARGDRQLGDAKARDLLALGLLIAEIASVDVARADDPLRVARKAALPESVAALSLALLAPEPGARPSARWVQRVAEERLGGDREGGSRHERRVRAAYLRLRRHELGDAQHVTDDTAAWARESLGHHAAARAMCVAASVSPPPPLTQRPERVLSPLSLADRHRWLVALVGSASMSWPLDAIATVGEADLAAALCGLAQVKRPEVWTLRDLESAVALDTPLVGRVTRTRSLADPSGAAELAMGVSRVPPDWGAVDTIEASAASAPEALSLAAADALRLAGQLGRARSLITTAKLADGRGLDVVADILRRCGDTDLATAVAERSIAQGTDGEGRARACLARIHYDAGELDDAVALAEQHPPHAATLEVLALCRAARGDVAGALRVATHGYALASTAESRARLCATLAFVEGSANDERTHQRFRAAAEHATQAGAVLEEASYRTGEAAAAVDLGQLESALAAAERAALLWEEVLDRPGMSARAWLARAAAFAVIDAAHEARHAATRAIARAEECGDSLAEAYAWWTVADVSEPGSRRGRAAAARGLELLSTDGDDRVQAHARLLSHAPEELDQTLRRRVDDACRQAAAQPASPAARLAWWGARARELVARGVDDPSRDDARLVVMELCALADSRAPVEARGRAAHAGAELAAALGETDAFVRLESGRHGAAQRVLDGARHELAEAARACRWLRRHEQGPVLDPARAIDLRQLVLALSERDNLHKLLDRVLDVLIMWTGAERGLLLMKDADGTLAPHAARNLGRADLKDEQLLVSQSLAERALASGEPVVAIDAMEELSNSYDSVHALKLRSVLALPLIAHGEVLGVVYLDDRLRRGAFGDTELSWAQSVAPVAALAVADARAQVELKRAVAQAEQASQKLEETLARKVTALDVAERELARTVQGEALRYRHAEIIGESEPMTKLLRLTDRVASSDVPVLLLGESGSGKELIARAIHRGSTRGSSVFVGENCGALPETLLESALFGHVKGAFTGAHKTRVGLFEAADDGTLFLDEIGEMSLGMQTKLLRVLEDSLVRPVGSTRARKVDVRVIAATNRDLETMVSDGSFREDLYYRLNVISLRIPPLRERPADIPLLVTHLIAKHAPGRTVRVTEAALVRLSRHGWPGNVRQLENEVRRALLLAEDTIDSTHLSIEATDGPTTHELGLNVRARIDHLEIELVEHAMGQTHHNQTKAAKLLGVSRYGLHKMMKRLGIAPHKRDT